MDNTAFIWDLDGTLLDSYKEVVSSVALALQEFGIERPEEEILDYSIKYSVKDYFKILEQEEKIDVDLLYRRVHEIQDSRHHMIKAEPGAVEILAYLSQKGIKNYVFTHRNKSAFPILEQLGMLSYFEEIVILSDGFKRKPDPEGLNYLIEKYHLNRNTTYYVGDRSLDMECAKNAGIRGVLYSPGTSPAVITGNEDFRVTSLDEVRSLIGDKKRLVKCPANVRLQDFLLKNNTKVNTPCGCRGNCGRCIIRVVEGELAITTADRLWLSEKQLEEGLRLACQAFPKEEVVIEINVKRG